MSSIALSASPGYREARTEVISLNSVWPEATTLRGRVNGISIRQRTGGGNSILWNF